VLAIETEEEETMGYFKERASTDEMLIDQTLVTALCHKLAPIVNFNAIWEERADFVATRTVHSGRRLRKAIQLVMTHEPLSQRHRDLATACLVDLHLMMPKEG
jgi:hypothetical protein